MCRDSPGSPGFQTFFLSCFSRVFVFSVCVIVSVVFPEGQVIGVIVQGSCREEGRKEGKREGVFGQRKTVEAAGSFPRIVAYSLRGHGLLHAFPYTRV